MDNADDTEPLSLDNFRKNNFSASWRVVGAKISDVMSKVSKSVLVVL